MITATPLVGGLLQLIAQTPLPALLGFHPSAAWHVPLWMWGMSFLICFSIAQILGWAEQHKQVLELTGRPDLTLSANYNYDKANEYFFFHIQNSGTHVAVNIRVKDIVLPVPKRSSGDVTEPPIIRFKQVDRLSGQPGINDTILSYVIRNVGVMKMHDICDAIEKCAEDMEVRLPVVIEFSNLGDPMRTWHLHCLMRHVVKSQDLTMDHLGTGEVAYGKTTCRYC